LYFKFSFLQKGVQARNKKLFITIEGKMASAFSLNRVTLIGNLGTEPELKTTPQGTAVCNFRMATTESYQDQSGNWQDKTDWHNIVLWTRLAERAAQYLHKGSKVYVEGKISTRTYEKDGITRYFTEIKADNFIAMASNDQQAPSQYGGQAYQGGQAAYNAPARPAQPAANAPAAQMPPMEHIQDEFDDDVPF
jgi:single-strand DNA-binding protein